MRQTSTGRRVSKGRDVLWIGVAAVAFVAGVVVPLAGVARSRDGFAFTDGFGLLLTGVVAFWLVGGALLRTSRGQAWISARGRRQG